MVEPWPGLDDALDQLLLLRLVDLAVDGLAEDVVRVSSRVARPAGRVDQRHVEALDDVAVREQQRRLDPELAAARVLRDAGLLAGRPARSPSRSSSRRRQAGRSSCHWAQAIGRRRRLSPPPTSVEASAAAPRRGAHAAAPRRHRRRVSSRRRVAGRSFAPRLAIGPAAARVSVRPGAPLDRARPVRRGREEQRDPAHVADRGTRALEGLAGRRRPAKRPILGQASVRPSTPSASASRNSVARPRGDMTSGATLPSVRAASERRPMGWYCQRPEALVADASSACRARPAKSSRASSKPLEGVVAVEVVAVTAAVNARLYSAFGNAERVAAGARRRARPR